MSDDVQVTDDRVRIVLSIMQNNIERDLDAARLARVVNLSVGHLNAIFREQTGMSVAQHFKWLRMKRAAQLFANSFLTVKEVCARIGSPDVSHFTRDFNKVFGCSPKRYRSQTSEGTR
jgi:AraC family transcriptional regulator, arabinose operon regulatory protein